MAKRTCAHCVRLRVTIRRSCSVCADHVRLAARANQLCRSACAHCVWPCCCNGEAIACLCMAVRVNQFLNVAMRLSAHCSRQVCVVESHHPLSFNSRESGTASPDLQQAAALFSSTSHGRHLGPSMSISAGLNVSVGGSSSLLGPCAELASASLSVRGTGIKGASMSNKSYMAAEVAIGQSSVSKLHKWPPSSALLIGAMDEDLLTVIGTTYWCDGRRLTYRHRHYLLVRWTKAYLLISNCNNSRYHLLIGQLVTLCSTLS